MTPADLAKLSPRQFQHLVQALALKELGHMLTPLGDGPDGGRDATYHGRIASNNIKQPWDGYTVFQIKHRLTPTGDHRDGQWLAAQIKAELKLFSPASHDRQRPDYYIVATNVRLSPAPSRRLKNKHIEGGRSRVEVILEDSMRSSSVPLKDFAIWDFEKISTLLDAHPEVRQTYAEIITSGDILTKIWEALRAENPELSLILPRFIRAEFMADTEVALERAGHVGHRPIRLTDIFMDLPVSRRRHLLQAEAASRAIALLVETGNLELSVGETVSPLSSQLVSPADPDHSNTSSDIESDVADDSPESDAVASSEKTLGRQERRIGRFVLVGGSGQGKTTLGRFLAQIYRVTALINDSESERLRDVADGIGELRLRCLEDDIALPSRPRFPLRVELAVFAKDLAAGHVSSLLDYFVARIRTRTGDQITASRLRDGLRAYKWVVILDGLDEVPTTSNRSEVLAAISDFLTQAGASTDMLVVATTRPQGYGQALSRRYYRHLWILPLPPLLAVTYAQRLIRIRYADPERQRVVEALIKQAAHEPATAKLMESPLHVTIMIALLEQGGPPPRDRWRLFERYYEVIYAREQSSDSHTAHMLRENKDDIDAIHRQSGLLLQIKAEEAGGTDPRVTREEMRILIEHRLISERGRGSLPAGIVDALLKIATDRLVFLVGDEDQLLIGFQIPSLREYMASAALLDGTDQQILGRMWHIVPMPHWRNVALFVAGRVFSQVPRLRIALIKICETLSNNNADDVCPFPTMDFDPQWYQIAAQLKIGATFALDLLGEQVSINNGEIRNHLLSIALKLLDLPSTRPDTLSHFFELDAPEYLETFLSYFRRELPKSRPWAQSWRLAMGFAVRGVEKVQTLVERYWPNDPRNQFELLTPFLDKDGSDWAHEKLHPTIGKILPVDLNESYESSKEVWSRLDQDSRLLFIEPSTSPWAIPLTFHTGTPIAFFIGAHRTIQSENSYSHFIASAQRYPRLLPWAAAAMLVNDPSERGLAAVLREIAAASTALDWKYCADLPWILQSCLDFAKDRGHLEFIADRAAAGELGTPDHWRAAEDRLSTLGCHINGLRTYLSRADTARLPFTSELEMNGLPFLTRSRFSRTNDNSAVFPEIASTLLDAPPSALRDALLIAVSRMAGSRWPVGSIDIDIGTALEFLSIGLRTGGTYGAWSLFSAFKQAIWENPIWATAIDRALSEAKYSYMPSNFYHCLVGLFTKNPNLEGVAIALASHPEALERGFKLQPSVYAHRKQPAYAAIQLLLDDWNDNDLEDLISLSLSDDRISPPILLSNYVSPAGISPRVFKLLRALGEAISEAPRRSGSYFRTLRELLSQRRSFFTNDDPILNPNFPPEVAEALTKRGARPRS